MSKTKINDLLKYLEENKVNIYAINNNLLSDNTDSMKNGYLKLLALILQQDEITKEQLMFFNRIVAGVNSEYKSEDYLRMALDIEIEDFNNYVLDFKKEDLKYRLILDSIILVGLTEKNINQIKLIAEYSEILSITKEELQYLVNMGKAVLELNIAWYVSAYEIHIDTIPDIIFYGYTHLISNDTIYGNENLTIFQPSNVMDVTVESLDKIRNISTPCIKLVNVDLDLSTYPLIFENKESVVLESCKFIGNDINSIKFKNCTNVIINDTKFLNFRSRTIEVESIDKFSILGCSFNNCIFSYSRDFDDWKSLGGVIYSDKPETIKKFNLDSTEFKNCGGKNEVNYYSSAYISNINVDINNCKFVDCWNKNSGGSAIDYDDPKRTMFTPNSKGTNNIIENSAKLN